MKVIFYDDPESDDNLWEMDLLAPPRVGDVFSLDTGDGYPKVGKVTNVEWCYRPSGLDRVEVELDLM